MHAGPGLAGEPEAFRQEVCAWLTHELSAERTAPHAKATDRTGLTEHFERALQREAGRRGWLGISVPAEFGGGGRDASFAAAFGYEAAYHDAPLIDTAVTLAAAPVMAFATPEQRAKLLPRMLAGEIEMCIAYTEPGAGNDLAALTTTALPHRDGGFVLSGRKTLITGGDKADVCVTIARTTPEVPARRGSSMFLVDCTLPGVSVVGQRTMADYDLWEVVFDDVHLLPDALLGALDGGWRQLAYSVEHERTGVFTLGWCQQLFDRVLTAFTTSVDGVRPADDPLVAAGLGELWAELQVARRSALALVAQEDLAARSSASASATKVLLTELLQRLAQFATEVGGPAATATGSIFGMPDSGAPGGGRFSYEYLYRFDGTVSVGANELHRIGIAGSQLELGLRPVRDAVEAGSPLDLLADGAEIRPVLRRLLGTAAQDPLGYDPDLWDRLRHELWPSLTDPASIVAALEEVGHARRPLPIHAGLVQVHAALSVAGEPGQAHLRRLAGGERCALGMHDPQGRPVPSLHLDADLRATGIVRHVTYGDSVDTLLVAAQSGEGGLILAAVPVMAAGVSRTTRATIADDHLTDFRFDGVQLESDWILTGEDGRPAWEAAESYGLLALCAESVGLTTALLEQTVTRVKNRKAFGGPLASLPTVQLRLGELYLQWSAARGATHELAAVIAQQSPELPLHQSAAKLTVSTAAAQIVSGAHQLCGGWGQLQEAGLQDYTRALKAAEGQLGTPLMHRERLGRLLTG